MIGRVAGGALYLSDIFSTCYVTSCVFRGNAAPSGGAIYSLNSNEVGAFVLRLSASLTSPFYIPKVDLALSSFEYNTAISGVGDLEFSSCHLSISADHQSRSQLLFTRTCCSRVGRGGYRCRRIILAPRQECQRVQQHRVGREGRRIFPGERRQHCLIQLLSLHLFEPWLGSWSRLS